MFDVVNREVIVSRQDTGKYTITFSGEDKPADGTNVLVTMKRKPLKEAPALWKKVLTVADGKVLVNIGKTDSDYESGVYWWDARILFDDAEEPYTPMNPEKFRITEVVGDA